jgi:hypothetical protein
MQRSDWRRRRGVGGINTTESVASALGISVQRVRQLIKELDITPTMIGRAIVLSNADVKKLENRNTQAGRPKLKK